MSNIPAPLPGPPSAAARALAARERLVARRRDLLRRYRDDLELAAAQDAPEPELLDAASAQWDARVLSTMTDADARTLDEVVAALGRVEDGTYGTCAGCGEPIEEGRLRVMPEAAQCAGCATFAEEQHPRWVHAFEQG